MKVVRSELKVRSRHDPNLLEDRRRLALRLLSTGYSVTEVARALDVTRQAIYKWRKAFQAAGKRGLSRRPRKGRPPSIDRVCIERLIRALFLRSDAAGLGRDGWTARLLTYAVNSFFDPAFDYHRSQVWRIARSLGWTFRRGRVAERTQLERWFFRRWARLQRGLHSELLDDPGKAML